MNTESSVVATARMTPALASESAVSWSAVLAGAAAAAALSLLMLMLGSGLGLSSVSPWSMEGVTAATFGVGAIVWITLTQFLASGMGGYMAGRLRSKWDGVHSDEVHFRDTAHGFLAWAVASLATAALLTGVIGSIGGGGVRALAQGASTGVGAMSRPGEDATVSYFVDAMLRPAAGASPAAALPAPTPVALGGGVSTDMPASAAPDASIPSTGFGARPMVGPPNPSAEVTRILVHSMRSGTLSPDDTHYLGQLVAQRSAISEQDAERKVSDTFTRLQAAADQSTQEAEEAADHARKVSSYAALWFFISLLTGAFIASLSALFGGRHRITY